MTIFQGLLLIDKLGLPHPEWEFVKTSEDLKKFFKIKDYVGWTIRTVKVNRKRNFKNLYSNWLKKNKVPQTIDNFGKEFRGKATFVIYPSWRWKKGGTLLIDKKRVVIEAKKGSIEELARSGDIAVGYLYNQKFKLIDFWGKKNFLNPRERKRILTAAFKILNQKIKGEFIFEWAITTQNKFIFYKVENLKESAQRLLKKYS